MTDPCSFQRRRILISAALCIALAPLAIALASSWTPSEMTCPQAATGWTRHAAAAKHVVLISIDGLHPAALEALGVAGVPHMHRLRLEGATTHNARTDADMTVTLPNHVTQLTGRGVEGACGHRWTANGTPPEGATLHSKNGAYISSVFDVLADAGLRAAVFASKSKFSLLRDSYGAPADSGSAARRDGGLERFVYTKDTDSLVAALATELTTERPAFSLLHLRDPDSHGHQSGWRLARGSDYLAAVRRADRFVGQVLTAVEGDSLLRGTTAVIVTADHAGTGHGHGDAGSADVYTIPFYVWGPGVDRGVDLYAMNAGRRLDPGDGRPTYRAPVQPIRNGDAANLALDLLGLPSIPGSTINTHAAPLVTSREGLLHVTPSSASTR